MALLYLLILGNGSEISIDEGSDGPSSPENNSSSICLDQVLCNSQSIKS